MGSIKGSSPNYFIFSTSSIKIYLYVVYNGSAPSENFLESIFGPGVYPMGSIVIALVSLWSVRQSVRL